MSKPFTGGAPRCCAYCRYALAIPDDKEHVTCQRFPPFPGKKGEEGAFPLVAILRACGEFELGDEHK